MLATFSIEQRIDTALRDLQCSGRDFVLIAAEKGIKISNSTFVRMSQTRFDFKLGNQLLEVLKLMKAAQDEFKDIPIDWHQHDRVAQLLTLVLLRQIAAEEGYVQLQHDANEAIQLERQ